MKNRGCLIFFAVNILILIFGIIFTLLSGGTNYRISKLKGSKAYVQPNYNSEVIKVLPEGTIIKGNVVDNEFVEVKTDSMTFYVRWNDTYQVKVDEDLIYKSPLSAKQEYAYILIVGFIFLNCIAFLLLNVHHRTSSYKISDLMMKIGFFILLAVSFLELGYFALVQDSNDMLFDILPYPNTHGWVKFTLMAFVFFYCIASQIFLLVRVSNFLREEYGKYNIGRILLMVITCAGLISTLSITITIIYGFGTVLDFILNWRENIIFGW